MPTTELVDEVGGTWFEVWIPTEAKRMRLSPEEVLVGLDHRLQMLISLYRDVPIEYETAQWRTTGALVLRAERLVDGYLVSVLGDRCLDVMRLARHPNGIVRCHVHIVPARGARWQPQSAAEALCASLQIR